MRRLAQIIFAIAMGVGVVRAADDRPEITKFLSEKFSRAILPITDDAHEFVGTGFLVDSARGYVLTACHVVQPNEKALGFESRHVVVGTPDGERYLKVLHVLGSSPYSKDDIALLEVENTEALKQITPVDISFSAVGQTGAYTSIGYPDIDEELRKRMEANSGTKIHPTMQTLAASQSGQDLEKRIQVLNIPAYGGLSGSPLLDDSGCVVGICHDKNGVGRNSAVYTRAVPAMNALLKGLHMSQRMRGIDDEIKSGRLNGDSLRNLLDKNSTLERRPSNLELFLWANYVADRRKEYDRVKDVFIDPILPKLIERGLYCTVKLLYQFGTATQNAEAFIREARIDEENGYFASALENAKSAIAYYERANDDVGMTRARMLKSRMDLSLDDIASAARESEIVLERVATLPVDAQGEAFSLAGLVSRRLGSLADADAHFSDAARRFTDAKSYSRAGEALALRAKVRLATGDRDGAQSSLGVAARYFDWDNNHEAEAKSLVQLCGWQISAGQVGRARATLASYKALPSEFVVRDDERAMLSALEQTAARKAMESEALKAAASARKTDWTPNWSAMLEPDFRPKYVEPKP